MISLLSIAGQGMGEKMANLLPERLDKILFLHENIMTTNFNLDWLALGGKSFNIKSKLESFHVGINIQVAIILFIYSLCLRRIN